MRFCLNYVPLFPAEANRAWWRACEQAGIERIGVADSPALARELYVTLTACLLDTNRLAVMPSVTNPVSRDPAVTAAALHSLSELAPGRLCALGLGTGDSALWGTGLKVGSVTRLRDYITAIRGLLVGEEVTYMGRSFRAEWADPSAPFRLPIAVACAGPRVLRMAAKVADALIISMGYGDENLDYIHETITDACREAGRDPNDLELWWNAGVQIAESSEAALAAGVQLGASWLTAGGFEGKQIPTELQAPLLEFTRDARSLAFMYKTPDRNRILAERAQTLGIYDWLLERSPQLWGTPAQIADRLRELGKRGLSNWVFNLGGVGIDRLGLVEVLAREVIPGLDR